MVPAFAGTTGAPDPIWCDQAAVSSHTRSRPPRPDTRPHHSRATASSSDEDDMNTAGSVIHTSSLFSGGIDDGLDPDSLICRPLFDSSIQSPHRLATSVVQGDDFPGGRIEHWAARAAAFGGRAILKMANARIDWSALGRALVIQKNIVLEGDR